MQKCPYCGDKDLRSYDYNEKTKTLTLYHIDKTQCSRSPVDKNGVWIR